MLLDGASDRLLLLVRQCAQGVGQGHAETARVEPMLQWLTKLLG